MSGLESMALLRLPSSEETEGWLQLASQTLQGYQPQPIVLRRTRTDGGPEHLEVRRWSPEAYLNLGSQLWLHPQGQLLACKLEAVRNLRRRADSVIDDETYQLVLLESPSAEQLDLVRLRCLEILAHDAYACWGQLDWEQRVELTRFGGGREQANQALALCAPGERLRTLQLLVGEQAQSHLREAVLQAAREGALQAGVEAVPWLLGQPDWNLSPDRVALARAAVQSDPEAAWALRTHPHALVRLRLVDLLELGAFDWLDWLTGESDTTVRDRLRQAVERLHTPARVVDLLMKESQGARREALGWLLVHWKGDIVRADDIKALNRAALSGKLGGENKSRLKGKLSRLGQLDLKARLFHR